MSRKALICGFCVLMVALSVVFSSPALAGGGRLYARGDYQIVKDDSAGTTVRVWVTSTYCTGKFALVTFAGKDFKGGRVQASYAVWIPANSTRPVHISFPVAIGDDPTIIVTGIGGA